jgi:hypothetical protein
MKKTLSILFAFLILVTSTHLSIATHFCEGKLAAIKVSFSDKEASCGMAQHNPTSPSCTSVKDDCCKNKVSTYFIGDNYNSSHFQLQKIQQEIVFAMLFPLVQIFDIDFSAKSDNTSSPPGNFLISGVKLALICVFRK